MPSHDHPEGIKGAQAIAAGIYLLRTGSSKEEVKKYISDTFGYDLDRKLDDIRPRYRFHVSCQKSVPEAIIAFLEGVSYEDAIRNAVSLGGDSDTIACMAGALAETIYEIPAKIRDSVKENLIEQREVSRKDFDFYNTVVLEKKDPVLGDQSFIMPNPWEFPVEKNWIEGFMDEFQENLELEVKESFGIDDIFEARAHTVEFVDELAKIEPGTVNDDRLYELAVFFAYIGFALECDYACMAIIQKGTDESVIEKARQLEKDITTQHYISCGIIS